MHKLFLTLAVISMACSAVPLSANAYPAGPVGAALATAVNPVEPAGCYRLGLSGYHWYRWCIGPSWLYPHRRICRHGYCWYR